MGQTAGKYMQSWSGGKDSALALYYARKAGIDVVRLFTMMSTDGFSSSHRIPRSIILQQADAIGVSAVTGTADWDSYEAEFKRILTGAAAEGFRGCVFGDIDLRGHLEWGQKICAETGLQAAHPLWGRSQESLMADFSQLGFEAVIVVVELRRLDSTWLGRSLDPSSIAELSRHGVTPAGELGEYHTLITGGPVFKAAPGFRARLLSGGLPVIEREGYAFLDLGSLG